MALRLNELGYDAEALRGGFDAWERADFPVEPK